MYVHRGSQHAAGGSSEKHAVSAEKLSDVRSVAAALEGMASVFGQVDAVICPD
jgi:hypothetical protein